MKIPTLSSNLMHTSCREPQVGGGNIGADREDVIEADIGPEDPTKLRHHK